MSKYLVLLLSCGAFLLGACSSVTPIRFKVHSEPEGAYVLYQVITKRSGRASCRERV